MNRHTVYIMVDYQAAKHLPFISFFLVFLLWSHTVGSCMLLFINIPQYIPQEPYVFMFKKLWLFGPLFSINDFMPLRGKICHDMCCFSEVRLLWNYKSILLSVPTKNKSTSLYYVLLRTISVYSVISTYTTFVLLEESTSFAQIYTYFAPCVVCVYF